MKVKKFNRSDNKGILSNSKNALVYMQKIIQKTGKPKTLAEIRVFAEFLAYHNTSSDLDYLENDIKNHIEAVEKMRSVIPPILMNFLGLLFPLLYYLVMPSGIMILGWFVFYGIIIPVIFKIQYNLISYYSYKLYIQEAKKIIKCSTSQLEDTE
ncbi:hypothetical protein [Anoxybacteroides tepidamans]|uniref:hypothetical protein n=1 Tax=Anoxybacteroides tepidamans TaxID=265948 RepID=UPI0004807DE4|nr:hypothetical protein [Anoxybacillus tepidamans]